jgi:DNA-binding transcriptional regulator YdaS (Cro superfamily)
MHDSTKALEEAIRIAGSQSALARLVGVKQAHVWNWLYRDKRVPAEYVLLIEKATGVSRHLLRPDIYPIE